MECLAQPPSVRSVSSKIDCTVLLLLTLWTGSWKLWTVKIRRSAGSNHSSDERLCFYVLGLAGRKLIWSMTRSCSVPWSALRVKFLTLFFWMGVSFVVCKGLCRLGLLYHLNVRKPFTEISEPLGQDVTGRGQPVILYVDHFL